MHAVQLKISQRSQEVLIPNDKCKIDFMQLGYLGQLHLSWPRINTNYEYI